MKKIISLLLILCSPFAFANEKYLLEGTIGKSVVYMSFEDYSTPQDNDLGDIRYFYKNSLKDIVLRGKRTGNQFVFILEDNNDTKTGYFEKLQLSKLQNGSFEGIWINKKGTQLAVKLSPFDLTAFHKKAKPNKLSTAFRENSFDFLKANYIQFKSDSASLYKGKTIEWFSEKHCSAPFFRLGKGFSEAVKAKINPLLNQIHVENVLSQLHCSTSFDYSAGDGLFYTIHLDYLDANLLGFNIFSSYDCGGAHPDFGGEGYLIDLHNGKNYEIDDIIAFDKSVTTEKQSSFDKYSAYRKLFFAPKLFELINKTEDFAKPENEEDGNCDYTDLDVWDYVSWNFTEKGIEFTPHFYRAARNCEEPFLVPFSTLRKHKNIKFPYKI